MVKQFLLIMDGITGSGKTTISKSLSKEIPRVAIIGMDKIKRFISDFKRGKRDNTIAKKIVFVMAKEYLKQGISVIVEQPFKSDNEIKRYLDLANEFSIPVHKVQLHTTSEEAFNRVITRQQDWEIKVPKDRIRRNVSLFKNREEQGFFIIDTSEISSTDAVKRILGLIKNNFS